MTGISTNQLYIGTSGLVLPVPNKQAFPPQYRAGSRLTYYASLFDSLEVNSSFYKVPKPATFAKWSTEVPADFRFTIKVWRGITHEPALQFAPQDVHHFMQAADEIGSKKGCLLIQLPPSARADRKEQLTSLLEEIIRSDPGRSWKIGVEFRNKTWYTPEINELLERAGVMTVLHDMPVAKITKTSGQLPFCYLRFHGPAGDYRGEYGRERLAPYAKRVEEWLAAGKEVYIYFNNTIGNAIDDAQTFRTLI